LQQQRPSFTQQAIPQASAVCVASAIGDETAAINKASAAREARSLVNRDDLAPDICCSSYYKFGSGRQRNSEPSSRI
jgi:hypothetical protein